MIIKTSPLNLECVSSVISENIIPVEKYCEGLASPKKLRKIIDGTGFENLSIADIDVCCSDMCFQAANHIFNESGISKDSIGALIFISQSQDYRNPATAYILQDRLKFSDEIIAFDISLGCSGFVYGLYVAASILTNLDDKKVMILCGDVDNWRHEKPKNTSDAVIFGDAGACAVISKKNSNEKILFNFNSYGNKWNYLYSEYGGTRRLKNLASGKIIESDEKNSYMNGMAVMDFTLYEVTKNIKKLLAVSNIDKDDIGAYLFHQPQKLLINGMIDELGVVPETVICNAQNIGNTSSASIPLLLTEIGRDWSKRENKKVLMSGFGVGLSVASVIMDLDDTICLGTKKYERS